MDELKDWFIDSCHRRTNCDKHRIICCRGLSRSVPTNYILLGIFTMCEAYLVGFIATHYEPYIVLAAAFSTAVVTAAISVYAFTTKKDFTVCGPAILVIGFTLCMTTLFITHENCYLLTM
jgi:FtsH-binding integral membrane protein